jgi:peptide/nickel transport system substrate-binding protein
MLPPLSRLTLTFVSLLALVACTPSPPPAPASGVATTQPAVEQTATIGMSSLANTLDPHAQLGVNGRRYDLYDCLVLPDPKGEPQPAIATAWKTLDDNTWQFTIRSDMKWHDGTPLTAGDVKFSFDRALDPARKLVASSRLTTIDSVSVGDPTTILIKTKAPDPVMLRRLAQFSIVPQAYLDRVGDQVFANKPVGSGPFQLKEWVPGDHITLTAFSEHPFRKPILKEFTIKQIPAASARVAGLQTGALDYANAIPLDQVDLLKNAGFETVVATAGVSIGYFMDTVHNDQPIGSPTADRRIRLAINYAVDKDTIAKQIYHGYTKPEGQLAQSETFGYDPNISPFPYDPAKAKQLLADAGYANGFKVIMESGVSTPELQPMALAVQQNLRDVGIDVEIQVLADSGVMRDKFYNIQPRAPLFAIPLNNSPFMDADASINWFWSKNVSNRHYNNPDFDRVYEASRSELDTAKRRTLLQQALGILHDDPPFLYVVSSAQSDLYAPKRLKGASIGVESELRFDKLEKIG